MESLVNDLKLLCNDDAQRFETEFRKQICTVFTRKVLENRKKLLFSTTDLVLDHVKCQVQDLVKGQSVWVLQMILSDLLVQPSELLRYYLSLRDAMHENLCFGLCLSVIEEWTKILQRSGNSDLKNAAY